MSGSDPAPDRVERIARVVCDTWLDLLCPLPEYLKDNLRYDRCNVAGRQVWSEFARRVLDAEGLRSTPRSDGCLCDPSYEYSDLPLSACPVHGRTGPSATPGQRCDMYVRTSAPPGDQPPLTRHIGNDVYVDRNEHGDVVGVEVLDAREIRVNGITIPFPGKFRDTAEEPEATDG